MDRHELITGIGGEHLRRDHPTKRTRVLRARDRITIGLSELHRWLEPEGLLILTVHGESVLRRCQEEENVRKAMCIEDRDYEEILSKYKEDGYAF